MKQCVIKRFVGKKSWIVVALLAVLTLTVARVYASELPAWMETDSRIVTVDRFVEWMEDQEYYKIHRIRPEKSQSRWGQWAQTTLLEFSDVSGCEAREMVSRCLQVRRFAMACYFTLKDCDGRVVKRDVQVYHRAPELD